MSKGGRHSGLDRQTVRLEVNGTAHRVTDHPMKRLLDVLRDRLRLTGTKEGCGEGECGACLVLVDGLPSLSCLTPICQVDTSHITTIEGLGREEALHPLQSAFLEKGGTQCGICTPGMILCALYYAHNPQVAQDAEEALAGNQCRCTGYAGILEAVAAYVSEVEETGS